MSPKHPRIVFTSSSVVFSTDSTDTKNLNIFNFTHNYSVSKYCNLLPALSVKKRYRIRGVSVHPGVVQIALFSGGWVACLFRLFMSAGRFSLTSRKRAALNVLNAALHPRVSLRSEKYGFFICTNVSRRTLSANAAEAAKLHQKTYGTLRKLGFAISQNKRIPRGALSNFVWHSSTVHCAAHVPSYAAARNKRSVLNTLPKLIL